MQAALIASMQGHEDQIVIPDEEDTEYQARLEAQRPPGADLLNSFFNMLGLTSQQPPA